MFCKRGGKDGRGRRSRRGWAGSGRCSASGAGNGAEGCWGRSNSLSEQPGDRGRARAAQGPPTRRFADAARAFASRSGSIPLWCRQADRARPALTPGARPVRAPMMGATGSRADPGRIRRVGTRRPDPAVLRVRGTVQGSRAGGGWESRARFANHTPIDRWQCRFNLPKRCRQGNLTLDLG